MTSAIIWFLGGVPVGSLIYLVAHGRGKKNRKCGCGHEFAYHNIATGKCHAGVQDYWDRSLEKYVDKSCVCQQYTGRMT